MRGILLLVALLAVSSSSMAAKLKPPLEMLRTGPSVTAVGTIEQLLPDEQRIVFRAEQTLHGKGRPEIVLRVDGKVIDRLGESQRVVLVYSDVDEVPGKLRTYRQSEEGVVLSTDGAEPALFLATPDVIAMFQPAHAAVEQQPAYRARVLEGIKLADRHLANLFSAELALRPSWWQTMSSEELDSLLEVIADDSAHPASRARLLLAAQQHPSSLERERLLPIAESILGHSSTEHPTSGLFNHELVVFAAFDIFENQSAAPPAALLSRWVMAANPYLAERALLALRGIDPALERQALTAALQSNLLASSTRRFLLDHLRRLDLAAIAAQPSLKGASQ